MKFQSLISTAALSLFSALPLPIPARRAKAQNTLSTVTDLGPAGSPFSQATGLNNSGLVSGLEVAADGTQHALAWYWGTMTDISKPGLGGPNSAAGGVNNFGQIIGVADTAAKDPNHENFCAFGSGRQCLTFLWDFGVMTPLPTLGGANSTFGGINGLGEVAGIAETSQVSRCSTGVAPNGTGPQVLNFEAVIWGPGAGMIRELSPLPGDTVGMAGEHQRRWTGGGRNWNLRQHRDPGLPGSAPHAVLWDTGTGRLPPSLARPRRVGARHHCPGSWKLRLRDQQPQCCRRPGNPERQQNLAPGPMAGRTDLRPRRACPETWSGSRASVNQQSRGGGRRLRERSRSRGRESSGVRVA